MPRLPKPKRLRQNREHRDAGPSGHAPKVVPLPPSGLLVANRRRWEAFWTSDLAGALDLDTDLPALTRLFGLYDERERAMRGVRKERLVTGSKGQRVLNPLLNYVARLDPQISQLEDRFGLTPLGRLKLGIVLGGGPRSLADINADLEEDDDARDADEEPDLRASLAATAADMALPAPRSVAAHARRPRRHVDGGAARPRTG